jgi:uncharacterized SAM-binding protein YcdF (DUF218 family)
MKKCIAFLRKTILVLLCLCGAGLALVLLSIGYVFTRYAGDATYPAECGIVFGTAVRPVFDEHGTIIYTDAGPGILRRVSAAADLYRQGKIKKLFMTGGKGEGMQESEASVMRRMAVVRGVVFEDITIEDSSNSTWENVRNTIPLMQSCKSIVGISDRYHLARIELLAARAGRVIQIQPATVHANLAFELRSAVREAIGILLLIVQIY